MESAVAPDGVFGRDAPTGGVRGGRGEGGAAAALLSVGEELESSSAPQPEQKRPSGGFSRAQEGQSIFEARVYHPVANREIHHWPKQGGDGIRFQQWKPT